jgi:UDP-GlcNAc:undecaprenyl-phosphate/decaprenyl-phosphate GlcNAc-1-phosphate transferase
MNFPFNVYIAAFLASLLISALTAPLWRRWCIRTALVDDPGHRKIHHTPIPLSGGLAVITGLIIPLLIGAMGLWIISGSEIGNQRPGFSLLGTDTVSLLQYGAARRRWQLAVVLVGAVAMVALGFLDDKHELSPKTKFIGQILIAAAVAASGIRITLFVANPIFSYSVTILWILTVINAFNFMDNMNGLCGGLGFISAAQFAISASAQGQYLVSILSLLACGALLGFLPYNFPRASMFLGDAGSHLVGYLLSVLAILPHFYTKDIPNVWAVMTPLLILAVPLGDIVWVVIWRWRHGKPVYVGDTNHLSHRLVRAGFSRTRAVLLIWFVAAAVGSVSLFLASNQ